MRANCSKGNEETLKVIIYLKCGSVRFSNDHVIIGGGLDPNAVHINSSLEPSTSTLPVVEVILMSKGLTGEK